MYFLIRDGLRLAVETAEEVKKLIGLGIDVNYRYWKNGNTILHQACKKGDLDIVKMLCEVGANVNVKNLRNYYPIDSAARAGELDIVKYLVEKYPNVKPKRALYYASIEGHIDVIDYLLTLNLELDSPRRNPLIGACEYGQIDAIDRLLNAGANTNTIEPTFGLIAMVQATRRNRLDIIKRLVVFDADYHRDGGRSLVISCCSSYDDISEFLIGLGCDVNCCIYNRTPLMHSCKNNNLKIVKLLLERGANPDFVNDNKKKAIDYCVSDEVRALFIKN